MAVSNQISRYQLENIVQERDRVSHTDAISLILSADLLYLPMPEGEYAFSTFPGKIFEYLATKRPILAVAPHGSEVERLLSQVGGSIVVSAGDQIALQEALLMLIDKKKQACPPRNHNFII